jgi:hypothetical protein
MDSDQAVNGLMARHILQGAFPPLYYGQDYCGSLEAYLISTVFSLWGASRFTLDLTICLESLFLILFIYYLAKAIIGSKGALIAALLTALPSYYLAFHSVLARSAYIEIPILGTFLFIIAHKIIYQNQPGRSQFLLLGLISGLCIWTQLIVVFYLVPIFLLIFIKDPFFWKRATVFYFFWGLLLGGLPLWVYNVTHPLATWYYLLNSSGEKPFLESLMVFFSSRLPEILGLKNNESGFYFINQFSFLTYGGYLVLFISLFIIQRRDFRKLIQLKISDNKGLDLLLIFFLLVPLIFSLTGFAGGGTSRYLTPIYSAIPILVGFFIIKLLNHSRLLGMLVLFVILLSNLYGTFRVLPFSQPGRVRDYRQARASEQALFHFLKVRGLRQVYDTDYWGAARLTFDAREEIVFAQPVHERYQPYLDLVDRSLAPAFIFHGDNSHFEDTLRAIGGSYKKSQTPGYSIYHDFSPPPYHFTEIDPRDWRVASNYNGQETGLIFDRDMATRWTSLTPQAPGMVLEIDLGKAYDDLGKMSLWAGKGEDVPRGLRLEISMDGKVWSVIHEIKTYWGPLFWSGPHPFYRIKNGRTEFVFPPQKGRFLRLSQLGQDKIYYWSIVECFIYRAQPGAELKAFQPERLLSHLNRLNPDTIYSSPWIEAHLPWKIRPKPEKWERPVDNDFINPAGLLSPLSALRFVIEKEKASDLAANLKQWLSQGYQEESLEGQVVFSPSQEKTNYKPISRKGWRITTNDNFKDGFLAIDGKIKTRWTSKTPQLPGQFFQVDMGRLNRCSRLRLLAGPSTFDYPRKYQIRVSVDGEQWQSLTTEKGPEYLYWNGENLLQYRADLDFSFAPTEFRYLRIIQTGRDAIYNWSIHELELYQEFGNRPKKPFKSNP